MKGLFYKDLVLLKNEKKFLIIIVLFCLFYPAIGMEDFCIYFMALMVLAFVLSSFAKDEFDNGNSFLFTLPFTKKEYVFEKYLLSFGGICAGILFGSISVLLFRWMKSGVIAGKEILELSAVSAVGFACVTVIMLPVIFKFGMEKGKIPAYLIAFLAYALIRQAAKFMMEPIQKMALLIPQGLEDLFMFVCVLAAVLLMAALSIGMSFRFIDKKEY